MLGTDVTLHVRAGQPGLVRISDADLLQLLTSMVLWGRDRLPLGGQVHVETGLGRDDVSQARTRGRRITLAVSASGYGVTAPGDEVPDGLAAMAGRVGGSVIFRPDEGGGARIELAFSRCSRATRAPGR
jgi:hypothetical protein